MTYTTHALSGVVLALSYAEFSGVTMDPLALGITILASSLPDIDEPHSKAGKKVSGFSKVIKSIFGHRSITHSLLGLVIFSYIYIRTANFLNITGFYLNFFIIGYAGHLLGDLFTNSGIPLLYPISQKFKFPLFKTGSIMEGIIQMILVLFLVYNVFSGGRIVELNLF